MTIGTKSILYGAHCWFIHPWFVAWAWWKLYGRPYAIPVWVAFFVHDLGYWGKPNMDGEEGECHVIWGAAILNHWFDYEGSGKWWYFCLLHSRYFAKQHRMEPSKLCYADKLAFCLTPRWIYLPLVWLTGEWREYAAVHKEETNAPDTLIAWHRESVKYVRSWVEAHKNGQQDTWTKDRGRLYVGKST